MDALSGRLARYRVTHAPYAVGETLAWLPPIRPSDGAGDEAGDGVHEPPYSRKDIDDLWRDLAAVDSLGMDDQEHGIWDESNVCSTASVEAALRRRPSSTFLVPEEAEFLAELEEDDDDREVAEVVNLALERSRRR